MLAYPDTLMLPSFLWAFWCQTTDHSAPLALMLIGTASGDGHDWYDASLPSESQTAVVWLEEKHFQGSGQRSMVGASCSTQG